MCWITTEELLIAPHARGVVRILVIVGLCVVADATAVFAQRLASPEAQVRAWVSRLSGPGRAEFERALLRAGPWSGMIAAKLAAAQLPHDLAYLPIIESGYNPWAVSSAACVGLWQLSRTAAADYGLEVSEFIDERRDPWKATDAALRMLKSLVRQSHGDWSLALASYNAGEGRVARAMSTSGGRTRGTGDATPRTEFWNAQSSLPRETQAYVPQLIAATRIGADPAMYGVHVPAPYTVPALVRILVPPRTSLVSVGAAWGVPAYELAYWNPALLRQETPNRPYAIVVPAENATARYAALLSALRGGPTSSRQ